MGDGSSKSDNNIVQFAKSPPPANLNVAQNLGGQSSNALGSGTGISGSALGSSGLMTGYGYGSTWNPYQQGPQPVPSVGSIGQYISPSGNPNPGALLGNPYQTAAYGTGTLGNTYTPNLGALPQTTTAKTQ